MEQKEPSPREPFTEDELPLLRTIEDPFWRTFVLLGENFGFRVSDVARLEWTSFSRPRKILVWTDKHDRRIELPASREVLDHIRTLPKEDPSMSSPSKLR